MDELKAFIDFFFNIILNVWNCLYTNGGIWFKVFVVVVFIFPMFNRIISTIISHGGFGLMRSGSVGSKEKKSKKEKT